MNKSVLTLIERCVACKSCELACAVAHSRSKTLLGAMAETPRPRPRIHVEASGTYSYPARCQHCQDAACLAACPTGAMTRNGATDAVAVDSHKCIGCWMCVTVCPFGAVTADPVAKKAHKCDLCPERTSSGLEPACVSACPSRALTFATPDEMAERRRQASAQSMGSSASSSLLPSIALYRALKGA